MRARIKTHREARTGDWKTVEEATRVQAALKRIRKENIVVIDCLTLLISNLLHQHRGEEDILKEIVNICRAVKGQRLTALLVSNEVGMGIVPRNRLGRLFRDIAGKANQIVAGHADEVYFLVAGIPVRIK